MKLVFLETDSLGDDMDLSGFSRFGDLELYHSSTPEETRERVKDADVIFSNKIPMNEETLSVAVTNVAGYSTDSVAQHTFAMVFYLLEKLNYFDDFVKSGEYSRSHLFCHYGEKFWELAGKTWGIIGLGAIGRKVAEIARAFGCHVIYYSTSGKNANPDFERVTWEELLERSDIVSVHAPLNAYTEGMMDAAAFAKMKPSAIFINVGRGPIVREEDLAAALEEHQIAAAGLDVMTKEPLPQDSPLLRIQDSRRLLITPHIAWASVEARQRLVGDLAANLDAWLAGERKNRIL